MIGTYDKRFGVADHDVQPMEKAEIGVIGFVFMSEAIPGRNVAAITIAVNLTAIGESGMGKFFTDACLILGVTRIFRKRGLLRSSKDSATKTFAFSVSHPTFSLLFGLQSTHRQIR